MKQVTQGSRAMAARQSSSTQACNKILEAISKLISERQTPLLIVLDGGSGSGKSTLASLLATQVDLVVVPLDDFFAADIPDAEWDSRSIEERARDVFDWQRVRRDALKPLLFGKPAKWYLFDFEAKRPDGTYEMRTEAVEREPAPVVLLEGAYSAHPNLEDLIDLTVLLDTPVAERHRRLAAREEKGFLEQWHARWDAVEDYYFNQVRPRSWYDLVVTTA